MNSHEIARLSAGEYEFRIYGSEQTYQDIIVYVGVVIGRLNFQKDPIQTMAGYHHIFICEKADEIFERAEDYITNTLGLEILAQGPYDDDGWIYNLFKKNEENNE